MGKVDTVSIKYSFKLVLLVDFPRFIASSLHGSYPAFDTTSTG